MPLEERSGLYSCCAQVCLRTLDGSMATKAVSMTNDTSTLGLGLNRQCGRYLNDRHTRSCAYYLQNKHVDKTGL